MLRALKHAWNGYRSREDARKRARLRAFVAQVVIDCFDQRRQADRLARWDHFLNHGV